MRSLGSGSVLLCLYGFARAMYALFEPHTDLIQRGKAQRPIEFGP